MEEFNRKTLIEALSTLPEYEPGEAVWEALQQRAMDEEFPKNIGKNLAEYEPPDHVWDSIERSLSLEKTSGARIVPMRWKRALAVAASVALLVVAGWYFFQPSPRQTEQANLTYATETVDDALLERDWAEDEGAFDEFIELCEAKAYVCEQPEFKSLHSELTELTTAKEELETAIGEVGANAELVLQIKEIELERTDLLKKMIAMLIG